MYLHAHTKLVKTFLLSPHVITPLKKVNTNVALHIPEQFVATGTG